MLFIFSIQSQITQLWQQISLKFTEMKGKDNPQNPPPPDLIVFIFKCVYCDYNGFPTEQKLHIKSRISRLSKKAQTDRSHKELSRSFFLFYTTNPSKVSSALNVLTNTPHPTPPKKAIYRRVKSRQAPRITSPIPTTVEASAFNNRDRRVDAAVVAALGQANLHSFSLSAKTVISALAFWS